MNARQEWLQRRQTGIGGSDVAAILGISPWKTPLDIYRSKVEPVQLDAMSEAAYWGTVLEDVVAREFAQRTGTKVQRVSQIIRHPEHDWMIANIDRAIVTPGTVARIDKAGILRGADGLLECKTASAYKASDWGREGDDEAIPVHYAAQAMWYLAVTGLPWCDFATLVGGQKFVTKRVERDEATIEAIFERCRAFWFDNVLARKAPEPINADDVTNLFPADDGSTVEANEDLLIAYNEAVVLRQQIDAAEKDLEKRVQAIKLGLGGASALAINGKPLITWRKAKDSTKTNWQATADQIKGWLIEQDIEGGVDAVRTIIDANTATVEGSRRFVFAKQ
jgi:putative phage-type endonuclease